jgi:dephospho-CoA kinase
MPKPRIVIGVAGRIGSGKTAIAHHIQRKFGFEYLRYSIVLADWYSAHPESKTWLQEIGWQVMSSAGQRELNKRLIDRITHAGNYVVDGLRHPIDFESLKIRFEPNFYLVFVDTPAEIRFERLVDRYATLSDFHKADSHAVESNIEFLKPLATVVLRGSLPFDRLLIQADDFVTTLQRMTTDSGRTPH